MRVRNQETMELETISEDEIRGEEEEELMELGNLNQELIEEIFFRVPLKSRARLKSVNKNWCDFITRIRRLNPLTPFGLVIFPKKIDRNPFLHSSIFIQLRDQTLGQKPILHSSLNHNFPWLIDSCNGLLLYATHDNDFWTYHVSNLFLDPLLALPRAHEISRSATVSLMFDDSYDDQFRVICFFRDEVDFVSESIPFLVLSSNSMKWKECEARIVNSYLLEEDDFVRGHCRPGVYSRRKLYWIWSFCLLIYDNENEFFKLVRLPTANKSRKHVKNTVHLSQLLWESDGQIHFCDPADEGFYIWAYVDDDESVVLTDYNSMWSFKKVVLLEHLIFQKIDPFFTVNEAMKIRMGWSRKRIQPVAFREDLQILYLHVMPGIIVSFSFETQRLEEVWSFGEPGDNNHFTCNIFPFLFNSIW